MMRSVRWVGLFGLMALVVVTSACTIDIARNDDGTLSVESTMSESALQAELEAALADDLIEHISVDLQSGYITVTAQRRRAQGSEVDDLAFRLELGTAGGQLTATVYNATLNDMPFDSERVAAWNGRIAKRLTRAAQRRPNSTLDAVFVTEGGLTMRWTVQTPRSRAV